MTMETVEHAEHLKKNYQQKKMHKSKMYKMMPEANARTLLIYRFQKYPFEYLTNKCANPVFTSVTIFGESILSY